MDDFVQQDSIVRQIWGKADVVLFIFAGASGEFALNKAVDWLYFTGKLPADPIGRLFSTVVYAHQIIFSEKEKAEQTIRQIKQIHTDVEAARNNTIPDWAYRDVLYMLVHYSIAAFELLERKLSEKEKEEVYAVFLPFGRGMCLEKLPNTYAEWLKDYEAHLKSDLVKSEHTEDLFRQYKKHLGKFRYYLLLDVQKALMPDTARQLLGFKKERLLPFIMPLYKLLVLMGLKRFLLLLFLPAKYRQTVINLDKQ
jgi:uncharacterized protein (DUF2236 family)